MKEALPVYVAKLNGSREKYGEMSVARAFKLIAEQYNSLLAWRNNCFLLCSRKKKQEKNKVAHPTNIACVDLVMDCSKVFIWLF